MSRRPVDGMIGHGRFPDALAAEEREDASEMGSVIGGEKRSAARRGETGSRNRKRRVVGVLDGGVVLTGREIRGVACSFRLGLVFRGFAGRWGEGRLATGIKHVCAQLESVG